MVTTMAMMMATTMVTTTMMVTMMTVTMMTKTMVMGSDDDNDHNGTDDGEYGRLVKMVVTPMMTVVTPMMATITTATMVMTATTTVIIITMLTMKMEEGEHGGRQCRRW